MAYDTYPVSALIKSRQKKFLQKLHMSPDLHEFRLGKALILARNNRTPMGRYIDVMMNSTQDYVNTATMKAGVLKY